MGNVTFTQFIWIAHYGLIIFYLFVIIAYIWSRFIAEKDKWETIQEQIDPHDNEANSVKAASLTGVLLGGHAFIYGISHDVFPLGLVLLILTFVFCAKQLADIDPYFKILEKNKRKPTAQQSQSNFEEPEDSDDDYFKSGRTSHQTSSSKSSSGSDSYGSDKRHPDDVKFWNIVDDPNASDGERQNSFSAILKRQAQRNGQTGRDIQSI